MTNPKQRIALLIDADNASATTIDVILTELASRGAVDVRLAFGDWLKPNLKGWQARLAELQIESVQQVAYTKGKNATDMAMVIRAMDLFHQRSVDAFTLVSSDADFTPLVEFLRSAGLPVYGFGSKRTPKPFVRACSRFNYVERLVGRSEAPPTQILDLLRAAVAANMAETGWAHLGRVRNALDKEPSFDKCVFKKRKFSAFMSDTGQFEIRRIGLMAQVRVKPSS